MLTFAYPVVFVLILLPLLVTRFGPAFQPVKPILRVPFFERLCRHSGRKPGQMNVTAHGSLVQVLLLWFCWLAVVVALARPQWLEAPVERTQPKRDLMLAVDLSVSMETSDFQSADRKETVTRLEAVKQVLDGFLAQRDQERVAIIVFGSAPFLQVPFTDDMNLCRRLLQEVQVSMAGPKTAFGDAMGLAIGHFESSKIAQKELIVLTDGNDTASALPPQQAANIAAQHGITVHTVGVGDPQAVGEAKFDRKTLQSVAKVTGGQYFTAADRAQLEAVYRTLDQRPTQPQAVARYRPVTDYFYVPLAAVLLLVLSWHGAKLVLDWRRSQREKPT